MLLNIVEEGKDGKDVIFKDEEQLRFLADSVYLLTQVIITNLCINC